MVNLIEGKPVADLPSLKRICNHPRTCTDFMGRRRPKHKNGTEAENEGKSAERNNNDEWWLPLCSGYKLEMSNKMLILSTILSECEARDEKLIVFSGCLSTLNVIEHYLAQISQRTRSTTLASTDYKGIWERDVDYSRLDGSQSAEKRKIDVTRFNKKANTRTRLVFELGLGFSFAQF